MEKYILGVYAENDSDALAALTQDYGRSFTRAGYKAESLDLRLPECVRSLQNHVRNKDILFAFGGQGVGSRLETGDGVNLWTHLRVPFVSIHHDNPCHNPSNHISDSPYIGNIYRFESHLYARERYFPQTPQLSCYERYRIYFDSSDIPAEPALRFEDRPIRFLYLKSYYPLEPLEQELRQTPKRLAEGLLDAIGRTEKSPNLEISDLVSDVYTHLGLDPIQLQDQFWADVRRLDRYVRWKRTIDFVEWLKIQPGAVIVGDGWDKIDTSNVRAVFKPAMNVFQSHAFYGMSQFICNTNPYGRDIIHERVVTGLAHNCCVISDTNKWWDENFTDVPALIRFDWSRSLDEQLGPAIENSVAAAENSRNGRSVVLEQFAPVGTTTIIDFAHKIADYAQRDHHG